jgi:hydrogenase expression/formation protein HypE
MQALGKIDEQLFNHSIFKKLGHKRDEVITGPAFGVDVSVVDLLDGRAMTMTSDPLSLIPSLGLKESAWLSVHLMANDMATTGFAPQYAQLVLNLPPDLSESDLQTYWDYIHAFCKDIGVAITGGHTCAIQGQQSTIAGGGTMVSIVPAKEILVSTNAKRGNVLLMTKEAGIVSMAILARNFPETVKSAIGEELYNEAHGLFYQTSCLKEALTITALGQNNRKVWAMHDITEGGVIGAVFEMATASGNGAEIKTEKIPVGKAQEAIGTLFGIDPRHCIGAGSLLIAVDPDFVDEVVAALAKGNIPCTEIGILTEKERGVGLVGNGSMEVLGQQPKDPYWDAFFNALNKGWK